jgi:hypothetical protein
MRIWKEWKLIWNSWHRIKLWSFSRHWLNRTQCCRGSHVASIVSFQKQTKDYSAAIL